MHDTSHHKHSHADHSCSDTDSSQQEKHSHDNHQGHHAHMVEDFRKKFWISLILSIPVLVLSPMVQMFFGIESLGFSGDVYVRFILASIIFICGG